MSYGIMTYAVDLKTFKTYFGLENKELKDKILQEASYYLSSIDSQLEIEDGWEPAKEILSNFLDGKISKPEDGAKHWYVVEILLKIFGIFCNNSHWYPGSSDPFFNMRVFSMYNLSPDNSINLPSTIDFPLVFTLYRENFTSALEGIDKEDLDDDQINQFKDWIKEATEKEKDLVIFCY